jgi:surface protein
MSNNIDLYVRELEISKEDIKSAIQAKGVTPSGGLSSYAEAILSIESSSTLAPLSETITEAGSYNYNPIDDGVEGYSSVEINVDIEIPTFETQEKIVEIKKNGTQIITPDSGYDGLSSVEVNVSVPTSGSDKTQIPNGFRFTGGDMAAVDFSQYDWSMVYDTSNFFKGCTHSTGDWSNFEQNFNGEVLSLDSMFGIMGGNYAASVYDGVPSLPNLGNLTSDAPTAANMCYCNKNLTDISNLKYWDTSNIIDASYMFAAFDQQKNAPQITSIDLTGFGHPGGYNANSMFKYSPVQNVKGLHVNGDASFLFQDCSVKVLEDCVFTNLTSTSNMFYNCSSLTSIPQLDTSNAKNMNNMFYNCKKIITIPQFDTSNATDLSYLMYHCDNLQEIPQLVTSKATNLTSAFRYCAVIETFPQIDISNVTSINNMLSNCAHLVSIPDFNGYKLTSYGNSSANSWLYGCSSLQSIGVIDCDSVTNIGYVLGNTTNNNLTHLGGFRNLGKASSVSNTNTTCFLYFAPNLTYESVMNVINLLYDRAANGLSTLTLKLHTNHMAMLSDDDKAIATNKGWTLTT